MNGGYINYRVSQVKAAGFNEVPQDTKGFLELCKALKAKGTPSGFPLGRATGDGNAFAHWLLWSHGAAQVDEQEKITINSAETRAALRYAKELWDTFIPGTAAWNDSNNNRAFLSGEISLTANGISIYAAAKASQDPKQREIAADMDHAFWPIGPIGKPAEIQLAFPMFGMTYSRFPNACKAFMAFILEAENFNPWLEAAQGYLTHLLNAYDSNPVWTADPKARVFRERPSVPSRPATRARSTRRRPPPSPTSSSSTSSPILHRQGGHRRGDPRRRAPAAPHLSLTPTGGPAAGSLPPEPLTGSGGPASEFPMADAAIARTPASAGEPSTWERLKVNRNWLGLWFMLPAMAFLVLFLVYPLGKGLWMSFTDARIGREGRFVGLENFEWLIEDRDFVRALIFTLVFTFFASAVKFAMGLYLALLLNNNLPFKAFIRSVVLIPFIVPTVLSAVAFWWIFDTQFSVITWGLVKMGLIDAARRSTGWATRPWPRASSSSPISGAASPSSPSRCSPACRPCRPRSTRPRPWTAPPSGRTSAM